MPRSIKEKRLSIAVIVLLLLLAAVGIFGFLLRGSNQNQVADGKIPPNIVSYPTIKTSVTSSKDGESHTLDIDLSVKYKEGTENDVPHGQAYDKIQESISELDYESLKTYDSIAYIKQKVKGDLSEIADPENISSVYIGNIVIDFPNVIETKGTATDSVTNKFKGLFQNMN